MVTVDPRGRHMTVNSNCLEGLRCPNCGQNNCNCTGPVMVLGWSFAGDLPWMGKIPPIFKSNLITLVEYAKLTVQECTHEEALEEMDLEDHAFKNTLEFLNDLLTEIG